MNSFNATFVCEMASPLLKNNNNILINFNVSKLVLINNNPEHVKHIKPIKRKQNQSNTNA